jgi:hypothetical protein
LVRRYCELNVFAMITTVGLVSTLGFLTILPGQFIIGAPSIGSLDFSIQSNGDNSGYIVCDPNCHIASNNGSVSNNRGSNNSSSNGTGTQPSYRLTVNVPSHPFGASTVGISITTENGHTDQASVPTAGGSSHTFNIPKDQGKWAQVCVNSGNRSVDRCHTYEITGSDMSVSLSPK